jgi:hypothetical protein
MTRGLAGVVLGQHFEDWRIKILRLLHCTHFLSGACSIEALRWLPIGCQAAGFWGSYKVISN